eukprot:Hpha_TRINITY_DN15369_c1_g1::TRINITY_DN15369_c1_g1_i1::g.88253::m.88253
MAVTIDRWEETIAMVDSGRSEELQERLRGDTRLASRVTDVKKRSLLHHASAAGNLEMVVMLLESNAGINAKDNDGRTALHDALQQRQEPVAECLLAHGADPCIADVHGNTPLHTAAYFDSSRGVQLLLRRKVDPNAADSKGCTPLHIAAHRASAKLLQQLLEKGGDAQKPNKRGITPQQMAERMNKMANVKALSSFKSAGTVLLACIRFKANAKYGSKKAAEPM